MANDDHGAVRVPSSEEFCPLPRVREGETLLDPLVLGRKKQPPTPRGWGSTTERNEEQED